jgi:hypothetical protein
MYFLEDLELARQLVELGCVCLLGCCCDRQLSWSRLTVPTRTTHTHLHSIRGNGEVIKRQEFEQRKAAAEAARAARLQRKPQKLASQGKDLEGRPLLQVCGGEWLVGWGVVG